MVKGMRKLKDIIEECSELIGNPYRKLVQENSQNHKYFGYLCIFTPEEIIHAAGFVPIRLFSDYEGTRFTDKYLPSQTCLFVRGLIETFRAGRFDFLEGCVLTHCCDALWGSFLAVKNFWAKDIYYINTPYKSNWNLAQHFLSQELEKYIRYLEGTYHVEITDQKLETSITVYNENHQLIHQLQCFCREGRISGSDYFTVQKAGYFIPKERHNELLLELIGILNATGDKTEQERKKVKLVLSGFFNGDVNFIKYIERAGGAVVADDLCGFSRYLEVDSTPSSCHSPLQKISFKTLRKFCPVGLKDKEWYTLVKEKYVQASAQGIIFSIYPFCDQQAIDYVSIRHRLNEDGIKTLFIQPTLNFKGSGQIETRIEAFLEMLQEDII